MKRTKHKIALSLSVVISLIGIVSLVPAALAAPATFTVTNTNDTGAGSLRQAIIDANSNGNPSDQDIITFSIATTGDVFIQPQTTLTITQSVLIDGYTQSDAIANTAVWPQPFNGLLRVGINNSVGGKMEITANNTTIRGLVFSRSTDAEIYANGVSGLNIYGNYFDTTNNGLFGNKDENVSAKTVELLNTTDSTIGGSQAERRNLFGYCANSCIDISGSASGNIAIKGNYIGVGADGAISMDTLIYSNYTARTAAIKISDQVDGVTIGGLGTGEGNSLEHNATGALLVQDSNGVSVLGNRVQYNFWGNYWAFSGIVLEGATNTIIGSAGTGANVISGNLRDSIVLRNSTVTSNPTLDTTIENNNIGVIADETTAFPNGDGISVYDDTQDATIVDNRIRNSTAKTGVSIHGNSQNISVLGNSIYNNAGIGINIDGSGSDTLTNTNDYLDSDTGPNEYLNSPGYTAIDEDVSTTAVTYMADLPVGDYRIEFFSNTNADPSGVGEGETIVGYDEITSDGTGLQEFQHILAGINFDNLALTATRIDPTATFGYGPTSEFGSAGEPYIPVADLQISTSLSNPEDIVVGSTLNYQVTITNQGPDAINLTSLNSSTPGANNLFMSVLPSYLSYASVSGAGITCTDLGAGSAGGISFGGLFADHSDHSVVTCYYSGSSSMLAPGSSVAYQFSVSIVESGVGSAVASFISPTLSTDPDDSAYQSFVTSGQDLITQLEISSLNNFSKTEENTSIDLGVAKTLLNPEDVVLGGVLNYEIKITNYGPSALDMSRLNDPTPGNGTDLLTDMLPPQLAYSGISGPNIACIDLGAGSASIFGSVLAGHSDHELVFCAHTGTDILESGDSVTYVLSATVVDDANPAFINHVMVSPSLGDPDAQIIADILNTDGELIDGLNYQGVNNYDYAFSQVADTSARFMLANPEDVAPGATLNYDFSYTNNGPNSMDPTVFDASGTNPFETALTMFILPPNLTYISQSNSDLDCTWAGPGSASFTPFFSDHNDYSLLYCAYIGSDTQLTTGESILSTFQFTTDSAPNSFSAYAITNTTIADELDHEAIRRIYAFDGINPIDIIQRLFDTNSNNFVLAAYTAPVLINTGGGSSSNSGGGNLADTGVNTYVVIPAVLLLLSLAGVLIASRMTGRNSTKHQKKRAKHSIYLVGSIIVVISIAAVAVSVTLKKDEPKKVIPETSHDSAVDPEERLKNIPVDAKSDVCSSVSVEQLSTALGSVLQTGKVSIPTAKTKEGSVSACMYIVKDRTKGGADTIVVTQRKFLNADGAQKSYSLLTKISDNNRKELSSSTFYNSNAKQIVSVKSNILTTASFTTVDKTINNDVINAVAKLF